MISGFIKISLQVILYICIFIFYYFIFHLYIDLITIKILKDFKLKELFYFCKVYYFDRFLVVLNEVHDKYLKLIFQLIVSYL